MTQYTETVAPEGDSEGAVLSAMAGQGNPYAFIVASAAPGDEAFDVRLAVGNGLGDVATIRRLLEKTLRALPEG